MELLYCTAIFSLSGMFVLIVLPGAVYSIRLAYLRATFDFFKDLTVTSNSEKESERAP